MIVVDTSVLIDFFRGKKTKATRHLQTLEQQTTPFWIPSICCQELLQGVKDDREWEFLHAYLYGQNKLDPTTPWQTHREAAHIYYACRKRGITVGTIDCYVAELVIENDGTLLHQDKHFRHIQHVRPLKMFD